MYLQQSRRLEFVNRSRRSGQLRWHFLSRTSSVDRAVYLLSLALDVFADLCLVSTYRRYAITSRPQFLPTKFLAPSMDRRAIAIALFPLINPTTPDTVYFGGIDNNMCTRSGIKCPSSTATSCCGL